MNLSLDTSHVYRLDEAEIPGVSGILDTLGFKTPYPEGEYKQRGSAAHHATALLDQNKIIRVGSAIEPYIAGYRAFKRDFPEIHFDIIEQQIYHPELLYAGTVDRAGYYGKKRIVADIKTGTPPLPRLGLQLAAYTVILSHMEKMGFAEYTRWGIELRSDGTYRLHVCDDMLDREVWIGLVHRHKWGKG